LSTTKQDIAVEVGKSETLNLSNSAGDIAPIVTWTSSNTDVATVSDTGAVTGVSEGSTTIKARVCKEELTYNVTVSAATSVQTGIKVKNKVVEVYKGYDFDLSKLNVISMYGEDEGSRITVTSEMITGTYDTNTVGEYNMTVTSGVFSDTFTIKVVELPEATIENIPGSKFGDNSGWGNFYIVTNIADRGQYLNLSGELYNKINSMVLVNGFNNSITGIKNLGGGRYEFWLASALSVGDTISIPAGMPIVQYTGTSNGATHNPNGDGEYVPVAELKQNYEFVLTPSGWVMTLASTMTGADASVIEEGSLLANLAGYNPQGTKSALKNVDQTLDSLVYTTDSEGHAARYFSHLDEQSSATELRFYLPGNAYKAEEKDTQIYGFSFKYRLVDLNAAVGTEAGTTYEDGVEGTRPASTTTSYMIQYVANSGSKYHCYDANLIADGLEHTFELNVACPSVNGFNIKLFRFQGEIILSDMVAVTTNPAIGVVQAFVDANMHMSETANENKCVTEGWYATAKEALNALTAEQRAIFASDAQFAAAYSRLQAWATANGESLTISSTGDVTVASNSSINALNNNNGALISIIAAMSCVALLGTALIIRKKKSVR
ncbi:MAG: Ig-like domain-containing protein, partial [Bacilli bacterium]|nr:Ig-like domain-containing protein [Bacilli bacterium]